MSVLFFDINFGNLYSWAVLSQVTSKIYDMIAIPLTISAVIFQIYVVWCAQVSKKMNFVTNYSWNSILCTPALSLPHGTCLVFTLLCRCTFCPLACPPTPYTQGGERCLKDVAKWLDMSSDTWGCTALTTKRVDLYRFLCIWWYTVYKCTCTCTCIVSVEYCVNTLYMYVVHCYFLAS